MSFWDKIINRVVEKDKADAKMKESHIVVGLGNPGIKYAKTKHNVGFEVIDFLAETFNILNFRSNFDGEISETIMNDKKIVLVKPMTFMNLSGRCISQVFSWYKADIKKLIVIYDDIDIEIGKMKIKPKGSAGTHNGMKSIIFSLKTDDFARIRIGIGKPSGNIDLANYVLCKFLNDERNIIDVMIKKASEAVLEIIKSDINLAMNKFN